MLDDENVRVVHAKTLQKVADDVKNAYGVAGQLGFNFQPADAKNWGV